MASADLSQELECPVCLTNYTDPVILRCGHNFFRGCIDRVLDTQEASGGYSCPECREGFMERPALQRNIALRNIEESFLSTQTDQEEEEVGGCCTYCHKFPLPAVMSCLMCEASLCDYHLSVHCKAPEHVLCAIITTTFQETRKCSVHKKILKYYCIEDAACICVSCSVYGGHVGHKMMSLDEASEEKKKKLRNDLQKLMVETQEAEKRVQSLEERRRKAQEKVDSETERATALFSIFWRWLKDLEKRVVSDITRQAERVSQSFADVTRQLEIKKEELSRKMRDIEELCNMTDPLTVLQESDTGDLRDTEEEDRHDEQLHDGWNLDVAGILHTLHTGLSHIISWVIMQKHTDTQAYPHSSTGDNLPITDKLYRPHTQTTHTGQHTQFQAGGTSTRADILLDTNTASNNLRISDDSKTASTPAHMKRPKTAERFQKPQVLSSQSFSSGRHYWEVDVGRSNNWRVGMCYPSIPRGETQPGIGYNRKSWCLRGYLFQHLLVHCSKEILVPDKIPSNRIGIYLDYEAGQISFYALCDPIRHLHTFTATFTEPLHAALGVWEGCVKILS
ncbi:E3 ubiquitin-protein ligase TRIM39-like [Hyperolius riggenbachi]|uniref:E3 ubiquitin-protein ligase TRIM39-like n=1 Tax=Hyperolius riggenbachi TaxID=752182 RepID=UPI0035A37698